MRKDFNEQWERRRKAAATARCPMGSDELRRRIWAVQWAPVDKQPGASAKPRRVWVWRWAVAAACVAAMVAPIGLHAIGRSKVQMVEVDGQKVLFACNNGCSPEGALEQMSVYIR